MQSSDLLNILVVEDNPADLFLLRKMLKSAPFKIDNLYSTDRILRACEVLSTQTVHLTLLDLSLPDSFGINSFLGIKELAHKIPVIILTGMADTKVALEALKEGAQDYLVKGEFNANLLLKSIQYSLERKHNQETVWESNERFNLVTKATNDAIWDWNLITNEVYLVGDTYKKLFGYDFVDAVTPQDFWENSLHPDDKKRVIRKLMEAIEIPGNTLWEDEYRLRRADNTYAYVSDRAYILYNPDQQPIRVIGAIQDITERKRLEKRLVQQENLRQQQLTEAVLLAQERERKNIGEELHDNINQILATSKLYIESALYEPTRSEELIPRALTNLELAIEEIRKLSKTLIAGNIHDLGLKQAIEGLIDNILIVKKIKINLEIEEEAEPFLSENLKITILRIIQEQLNNILKHANASSILIRLHKTHKQIHLLIADDGIGFDPNTSGNGVGILNIRNRAQLYGGHVDIDTAPGQGCRLRVRLHYKDSVYSEGQ